jgi:hypothetical protein
MLSAKEMILKQESAASLIGGGLGRGIKMDGRTAPLVERLPARAFRARAARGPDARLAEVLSTIVDHLARVVAETGATRDDLRRLIGFRTSGRNGCFWPTLWA